MTELSDDKLLMMIRGSDTEMQAALAILFADGKLSRDAIQQIVKTYSAQTAVAEDIVQNTFGTFVEYVKKDSFTLTGSLKGLFIVICKGNWRAYQKSEKKKPTQQDIDLSYERVSSTDSSDDFVLELEKRQRIRVLLLSATGPECRKIIWFKTYHVGFDGEEVPPSYKQEKWFRQRLEKCRKKVLKFLREKPVLYDEFKNYAISGA